MKILVIGKHGQIASALQTVAQKNNVEIFAFGRDEIDITQPLSIEKKLQTLKPDVVINTAAYLILADCENNPDKAFEMNTTAIYHIAKLCKKYEIQFVTYSTDYVFDGKKGSPYLEEDSTNPLQIYGLSKVAGEIAARNYYPEGSYVIRTSGVFGGTHGSTSKKGNFVLGVLDQAKKKEKIEVSSTAVMSPTYADDLATATLQLLVYQTKPDIYHLTNEGSCSWQELAEKILKYSRIAKPLIKSTKPIQEHFIRPQYTVLANTNAKKIGITLPSFGNSLQKYLIEDLNI